MDLKSLMSGIAVVIDDAIENSPGDGDGEEDSIGRIVELIQGEWDVPFLTAKKLPPEETWPNLLRAASFVLLDWQLWQSGASELAEAGIRENVKFLEEAKKCFVPVFIFTNENPEDIRSRLPESIYPRESPDKSFVFIQSKNSLLSGGHSLDMEGVENWLRHNASVYALKAWEQVFYTAKGDLFSSMYARNPD